MNFQSAWNTAKKKALLFKTRQQQTTQDIPSLTPAVMNQALVIYLLVCLFETAPHVAEDVFAYTG